MSLLAVTRATQLFQYNQLHLLGLLRQKRVNS